MKTKPKSRRGFAAMHPDVQKSIASLGGETVSKNRKHMARIGAIGGTRSHSGDGRRASVGRKVRSD